MPPFAELTTLDPRTGQRYAQEPELEAMLEAIASAEAAYRDGVRGNDSRGNPYGFGGMRPEVSRCLYAVVRAFAPRVVVETGVCNGSSSAVLLAALERNGAGTLHSLDLPEHVDTDYPPDAFWSGKRGAAVPHGREPGWVIPGALRGRWHLSLGRSQDVLPGLLARLGTIDLFLHDSEHSYDCMTFEYRAAWHHLRPGGILLSDDISWNRAFADFAQAQGLTPTPLAHNLAGLQKPLS